MSCSDRKVVTASQVLEKEKLALKNLLKRPVYAGVTLISDFIVFVYGLQLNRQI